MAREPSYVTQKEFKDYQKQVTKMFKVLGKNTKTQTGKVGKKSKRKKKAAK